MSAQSCRAPRQNSSGRRPMTSTAEQCVWAACCSARRHRRRRRDLRAPDILKPAHQSVYDIVLDLYGRGEPADAVTVAAELTKRGEIARIGGAGYLHTLIASVPTAANASYYARIVHERAVLRRLVEAGTRIAQMGYAADGSDADDTVDRAQPISTPHRRLGQRGLPPALVDHGVHLDEIEASAHAASKCRGADWRRRPRSINQCCIWTNGNCAARPAIGKSTLAWVLHVLVH